MHGEARSSHELLRLFDALANACTWRILAIVALLSCITGCQTAVLRRRTLEQASTASDYFYIQVLNNLAQIEANPYSMPYFVDPKTQQTTIARTIQANYGMNWDFITSGVFLARYLFDKQSSQIQGQQQTNEGWQASTTDNPDKIMLMQAAYRTALNVDDEDDKQLLDNYYEQCPGSKKYQKAIHPGWFFASRKKHDVPKCACYVGQYGSLYVWVTPGNMKDLTDFTLAIMDVATIQAKERETKAETKAPSGEAGAEAPLFSPRDNYFIPFSLPNPASVN